MSSWETKGKSDEWYTPKYIFDALGCEFDLDVAHPGKFDHCQVPAKHFYTVASLNLDAVLFVNGKIKFIKPDGSLGKQPGNGTTLFAYGETAITALKNARDNQLGIYYERPRI